MKTRKNRIMKINDFIKNVSIMTALAISTSVFAAESPPPVTGMVGVTLSA